MSSWSPIADFDPNRGWFLEVNVDKDELVVFEPTKNQREEGDNQPYIHNETPSDQLKKKVERQMVKHLIKQIDQNFSDDLIEYLYILYDEEKVSIDQIIILSKNINKCDFFDFGSCKEALESYIKKFDKEKRSNTFIYFKFICEKIDIKFLSPYQINNLLKVIHKISKGDQENGDQEKKDISNYLVEIYKGSSKVYATSVCEIITTLTAISKENGNRADVVRRALEFRKEPVSYSGANPLSHQEDLNDLLFLFQTINSFPEENGEREAICDYCKLFYDVKNGVSVEKLFNSYKFFKDIPEKNRKNIIVQVKISFDLSDDKEMFNFEDTFKFFSSLLDHFERNLIQIDENTAKEVCEYGRSLLDIDISVRVKDVFDSYLMVKEFPKDIRNNILDKVKTLFRVSNQKDHFVLWKATFVFSLISDETLSKIDNNDMERLFSSIEDIDDEKFLSSFVIILQTDALKELIVKDLLKFFENIESSQNSLRYWMKNLEKIIILYMGLEDNHPLTQQLILHQILLSDSNNQKNPYIIYQKLQRQEGEQLQLINNFKTRYYQAGKNIDATTLVITKIREFQRTLLLYKDCPKASYGSVESIYNQLLKKMGKMTPKTLTLLNKSVLDQLGELDDSEKAPQEKKERSLNRILEESKLIHNHQIKTWLNTEGEPNTPCPDHIYQLKYIINKLSKESDEIQSNGLSKKEELLLLWSECIYNCPEGMKSGIALIYKTFHTQQGSEPSVVSPVITFVESSVNQAVLDQFDNKDLIYDLIGASKKETIGELVHHSKYIKNSLNKIVFGDAQPVIFDIHTGVLRPELLEKTPLEIAEIYFKYLTPEVLIEAIQRDFFSLYSQKESKIYGQIAQYFEEKGVDLNDAFALDEQNRPLLTVYGAHALLKICGYLK